MLLNGVIHDKETMMKKIKVAKMTKETSYEERNRRT